MVERSGATKVLIKGDGSGPHTVGSSTGKAFTSSSMGRATLSLANFMKDHRELDGPRDMDPRLVILGDWPTDASPPYLRAPPGSTILVVGFTRFNQGYGGQARFSILFIER